MEVKFYDLNEIEDNRFLFTVVSAVYKGKWIFARHRDRTTLEMPGGHREENERLDQAASRELYEETGALKFELEPVCDYTVTNGAITTCGRMFFANVLEIGPLPESEICEVHFLKKIPGNLTYPEILPLLHQKILDLSCKRLLEHLNCDRCRNINMIKFLEFYPIYTVDRVGESVLIRGKSDEDWVYASSRTEDEFKQLIQRLDEQDKCFAVLEDWMLPYIIKNNEIRSRLTSMKFVYDDKTVLPPVKSVVRELQSVDALDIFENSKYQAYLTIEYIEERIKNGTGAGIEQDGRLVAWALTHDDGAIGFLNVLTEYRQKGYGTDILVSVMKKLLDKGELPFVHIEEENTNSIYLALKVGFKQDRRIHWIKID